MSARLFALFDTAIGPCGIVWTECGVTGLQLTEGDRPRTRSRLLRRFPESVEALPPPEVQETIRGVVALLDGERTDFPDTVLDLEGVPAFAQSVYAVARTIGPGATLTYGEVAARIGSVGDARAVGQALGRNPVPVIVPCHRVLAASGRTGGFSAPGGVKTKMRLLSIEARHAAGTPGLFGALPLASRPARSR